VHPKHKSLEEYVNKASAKMLNEPGTGVLTWCTADTEADYRRLQPGEFFNHFHNNKELTTKIGLARNLSEHAVASRERVDNFFPRCYDVAQRADREDFVLDFRRSAALKIAMLHLRITAEQQLDGVEPCEDRPAA
jgi:hypothetical protein